MLTKTIPVKPQRVLLVNPTKYLGNLLIAGGLMQAYADHCQQQGIKLLIVIDASFKDLCEYSFHTNNLVFYPRQAINKAGWFGKIILYWKFLKQLRAFKADLAFNIEDDSATNHLTKRSGATFKLGCSPARHKSGYDHILPIILEGRPTGQEHRWNSYCEVFVALGMPQPSVSAYLKLNLQSADEALQSKLKASGIDYSRPVIALHAGATKEYKQWPLDHFTTLLKLLHNAGMQTVLLGAGHSDETINRQITKDLGDEITEGNVIDLCNTLTLKELAVFLSSCHFMIGNDSGPFHLGAAMGTKGSVIFGPTNKAIWGPLGTASTLIHGEFKCDPACSKAYCLHDHRCLKEIKPDQVFSTIQLPSAP
jgi:ADP-heptose:LPS heptosyltransferase